jgi:hypothetical protein
MRGVTMQGFLSDFIISIVPTFVVSRVLLWITSRWFNSLVRLVAVHAASLTVCVAFGAFLFEGINSSPPVGALALFAPGQLAWFLIDLFRVVLKRREAGR